MGYSDLGFWFMGSTPRLYASGERVLSLDWILDRYTTPAEATIDAAPARLGVKRLGVKNLGSDVISFCRRRNLTDSLMLALELVLRHMGPLSPIEVTVERDPESDEDWLTLDVKVEERDVLERYMRYGDEWERSVGADQAGSIRLSFEVI